MLVGNKTIVSIHYVLTNDQGETLDQSQEGVPLVYLHGAAGIIPGLEKELTGKAIGSNFKVTIAPEEAYGEHNEQMVQEVPKSAFPADIELQVGMQFQAQSANGASMVAITAIQEDTITVDGNHPLAGMTLHFEGSIENVREATQEEIEQQSAH